MFELGQPKVAKVSIFQVAEVPTNLYDYTLPIFLRWDFFKWRNVEGRRIYQAKTKWSHLFVYIIMAKQFRLFIAAWRAIM